MDIWQLIETAALYEKGLPPVAGGQLDQARSFLLGARMVWAEQQAMKDKLGIFT